MKTAPDISIIPTGTANIASVRAAFARLGATAEIVRSRDDIVRAQRLVLPGVGAFGVAMKTLVDAGFVDPIRGYIDEQRPLLAICVGMQILCARSDESPGVAGLGVIDASILAFDARCVRTPQLGWNRVVPAEDSEFLGEGVAYFANGYRLARAPEGWSAAMTVHGEEFVSALERPNQLAMQCHPELSGDWGARALEAWLTRTRETVRC